MTIIQDGIRWHNTNGRWLQITKRGELPASEYMARRLATLSARLAAIRNRRPCGMAGKSK
ncbi:hypothetical protein JX85_23655 [Salmonella enterica]|nr:hypothetical protein [Salmonella enterica]